MIFEEYSHLPDFPFDRYFESVNQYIAAQQYWFRVLRTANGFVEGNWQPVIKAVNVQDDMYIGLLVDIENNRDRKSIKIHATSLDGYANFVLKEDLETAEIMGGRTEELISAEMYDTHDDLVASGAIQAPITTLEGAQGEAQRKFAKTGGFEAGVDKRNFYIEGMVETSDFPYETGEEFSIISSITAENESKALKALELFLQDGAAMDRVNNIFVSDKE